MRGALLPYGRQSVDEDDVREVEAALRSDWLTTGPRVGEFEQAFARFTGAPDAVATATTAHAAAAITTALLILLSSLGRRGYR